MRIHTYPNSNPTRQCPKILQSPIKKVMETDSHNVTNQNILEIKNFDSN